MAIETREEIIDAFQQFFNNYKTEEDEFKYADLINRMIRDGKRSLTVKFDDLVLMDDAYEFELAETLMENPILTIDAGSLALREYVRSENPDYVRDVELERDNFTLRFSDTPSKISIRDIRASHVDTYKWLDGIIIRTTEIKSIITQAIFVCKDNNHDNEMMFTDGIFFKPDRCIIETCKSKEFLLDTQRSKLIDWQHITLQEKPEDLPPGASPKSITCRLTDDIVNAVRPGDRVQLGGLVRTRPSRQIKKGQILTFDIWIDVNYIESLTKDEEFTKITPEEEKEFLKMAEDPKIQDRITDSIAPAIYGLRDVKEAAALLLFGGVNKVYPDGLTTRGQPNVLLVGDPGVAKSQLLRYIKNIAPRGIFTSGKGSSAAGLCVSGDSQIILSNRIARIADIVETNFSENNKIIEYRPGIEYVENYTNSLKTNISEDLKIESRQIEKFWKIKSPENLILIKSRTGRELKTTPQTNLLTLNNKYGLVWKSASMIEEGDKIASSKKLYIRKIKTPTIIDILNSYPKEITLLEIKKVVKGLIGNIDLTKLQLASKLGVSSSTIQTWINTRYKGNISLKNFNRLCEICKVNPFNALPETIKVQIQRKQIIKLPKILDENWFYILGLIVGDGRVSVDKRKEGYDSFTIGLSNKENTLIDKFAQFFENLGFKPNIRKGSQIRPTEIRIFSKLIFHIFSYFGLRPSPKSSIIKINSEMIFYDNKYITSFLRGLYDTDGWIINRDKLKGSSQIGISSTSKNLIDFIRKSLMKFNIISYLREISPKTVKTDKYEIIGRNKKYELTFTNYADIQEFGKLIGFIHPKKMAKLEKCLKQKRTEHYNIDNVPNVYPMIKKIIEFYNYTSRDITGKKSSFSPSKFNLSISYKKLEKVVKTVKTDLSRHKINLPFHIRNKFFKEIKFNFSIEEIKSIANLSESQLYEYFKRNRNISIPYSVINKLIKSEKCRISKGLKEYFEILLDQIKDQDKFYKSQYRLLKYLVKSDIFWDEVVEKQNILSQTPFVYDLTIPKTHNFIVNGFVVHNTAAIIRDPETSEITLEAGALVLADRGICVAGNTKILSSSGSLLPIKQLYDQQLKPEILSFNETSYHLNHNKVKNISRRYSTDNFKIRFSSHDELTASSEHPLPVWDNGIIWKKVQELVEGDIIIDYRDYKFKLNEKSDEINLERKIKLAEFLGLIITDGNLSKRKYNINFYTKSKELIKKYTTLVDFLFHIKVHKFVDKRNGVSKLYFGNKEIHLKLQSFGIPKGNKSKLPMEIPYLYHERKEVLKGFIQGVINGDGSISNRKGGGIIDITTGNLNTAKFYHKLLRKFGVISSVNEITINGGGVVPKGKYKISKLTITGVSNLLKLNDLEFISYKRRNFDKIISRQDKSDLIYNIDKIINSLSDKVPNGFKNMLYNNSIRKSTLYKSGVVRDNISKTLDKLKVVPNVVESKEYQLLSKIIQEKVYFNKVVSIEKAEPQFVYNLQIDKDETYLANFIPVHNCLIDEFDKMNENDRSAIHEAMEQHSYHPKTEIRFTDGTTSSIGDFIDKIFNEEPKLVQEGINCKLINIEHLKKEINSSNLKTNSKLTINRISKHDAPEFFYKITFSNGRNIVVTSNHPIYVFQNKQIKTLPACEISKGMYIPSIQNTSFNGSQILNLDIEKGNKNINLPNEMNTVLAKFLGYFVAEGYSHIGSTYEIGLSNSHNLILKDMKDTIMRLFGIEALDYSKKNRTLRIISKSIYNFMKENFPELLVKSIHKRIPSIIFRSSKEEKISFIYGAYQGDGTAETETLSFNASSHKLACDYQDLLLSIGIYTRIRSYNYSFDIVKKRLRYKIYIQGESIADFVKLFNYPLKNYDKILDLVKRSSNSNYRKNNVPTEISNLIIDLMKDLHIPYDGGLWKYQKSNSSISRNVIKKYLNVIESKIENLSNLIPNENLELKDYRKLLGYSQISLAQMIKVTRGTIDYAEREDYDAARRRKILSKIKSSIKSEIKTYKARYENIENLLNLRWNTIRSCIKIPNSNKYKTDWVYDITVLPNKSFIGQGEIILHNSVSVAKAGIVATLNARTGVLAAANPKYGRYEPHRTFNENVNLSPAILSRFDLIFIIRDEPEIDQDTTIASHILNLHRHHGNIESAQPLMSEELLKKYIAYAKHNYNPVISDEASEIIENFYVTLRNTYAKSNDGSRPGDRITITARQLEGIIRLSEARARASLRNIVTKHDAQKAIDLVQSSLGQVAIDPDTGASDIDAFYSGQTSSRRTKLNKVLSLIDFLYREANGPFKEEDLIIEATNEDLDEEYVRGIINSMKRDGTLYQPRTGWLSKP